MATYPGARLAGVKPVVKILANQLGPHRDSRARNPSAASSTSSLTRTRAVNSISIDGAAPAPRLAGMRDAEL